jgi:hypothetical protein
MKAYLEPHINAGHVKLAIITRACIGQAPYIKISRLRSAELNLNTISQGFSVTLIFVAMTVKELKRKM